MGKLMYCNNYNKPIVDYKDDNMDSIIFLPGLMLSGLMDFIIRPGQEIFDVQRKDLYFLTIPKNKKYITAFFNKINYIDLHENISLIHIDIFTKLNCINNKELSISFW